MKQIFSLQTDSNNDYASGALALEDSRGVLGNDILLRFHTDKIDDGWICHAESESISKVSFEREGTHTLILMPDGERILIPDYLSKPEDRISTEKNGVLFSAKLDRSGGTLVLTATENAQNLLQIQEEAVTAFCFDGEWLVFYQPFQKGHVYVKHIEKTGGKLNVTQFYEIK